MERSKAAGKERDVLGDIREARHTLVLEGRITGEFRDSRDAAPDTAIDAIIKLASALSEAKLRKRAAGEQPEVIEGEGHVIAPESAED